MSTAFRAWRGNYKTESRFAGALRKENLLIQGDRNVELTSKVAVDELSKRKHAREKKRDRERKKAVSNAEAEQNVRETKAVKRAVTKPAGAGRQ